jgi:hypothetical protein
MRSANTGHMVDNNHLLLRRRKMKQDHKFEPTKIVTHTHTIVGKLYDYYTDKS